MLALALSRLNNNSYRSAGIGRQNEPTGVVGSCVVQIHTCDVNTSHSQSAVAFLHFFFTTRCGRLNSLNGGVKMVSTVRVPVSPKMLEWAIQYGEKTQEELLTKKVFKRLPNWLSGEKLPTLNQLKEFSSQTAIPFSYFTLKEPPKEEIPLLSFRTINNDGPNPSRSLIDTINTMEMRQDWMKGYLEEMGQDQKLSFVASINQQMDIQAVANNIREMLDLTSLKRISSVSGYLTELKHRVSKLGIMVMQNGVVGDTRRKLDIKEFRAFVLIDDIAPLVFLNRNDALTAMVFSLIHEVVHIFLGKPELLNVSENNNAGKSTEQWINHVTELILMPEVIVRSTVKGVSSEEAVLKVSNQCHVSRAAAVIRLSNLSLVNNDEIEKVLQQTDDNVRSKVKKSGGNYYSTHISRIDITYANAVINSQNSGYISTTAAAGLVGTSLSSFGGFKENMGMGSGL